MVQRRSGMEKNQLVRINLSDISVKETLPDNLTVNDLLEIVQEDMSAWKELNAYYRCAMMEIETKFKVLNEQFSLRYDRNPIETIKARIKSPESIAEKLIKKKLPITYEAITENINDFAGLRIICSFPEDIYMLADCLLQQDDITLIKRKDYIKNPKPNGYRGLHLVVEVPIFLQNEKKPMKVEVQLRTIAMDFWASLEHKLRYKKNLNPKLSAELEKELKACSDEAAELDIRMQSIRKRIEAETAASEILV